MHILLLVKYSVISTVQTSYLLQRVQLPVQLVADGGGAQVDAEVEHHHILHGGERVGAVVV